MAAELLNTAPADKHLLILLTDASPDDSHKILPTGKVPLSQDYDSQVGGEDTVDEVRALRRKGNSGRRRLYGGERQCPQRPYHLRAARSGSHFTGWTSFPAMAGRLIQTRSELSG